MPDWLWLKILAFVLLFISCIPLINYLHIIFSQRGFNKGTELLSYTIFGFIFNISVVYIVVTNLTFSKKNPSFILFLACVHLFIFTFIAAAHPAFYGLSHAINALPTKTHKVTVNSKVLKTIIKCYIFETDIEDRYFLSSEFALIFLLLCYLLSGIITVSSIGNGLMVSLTNIGSSNLNKSMSAKAILAAYDTDLQLYKDLFLLSVVPLAIPQFVHALKKS